MIKYALRDSRGNRVMTAVIGIQTFVVFVTLICMMSVVMFRYDQYHDISGLISGDGQVLRLTGMAETPQWHRILSDRTQAESLYPHTTFDCMYHITFYEHEKSDKEADLSAIGYDEALADCHVPKMARGKWLNERKKETDEIPVVVAQENAEKGYYKVGDRLLISRPGGDTETGTKKRVEMTLHVIGIAEENAQFIGPSDFNKNYTDARGLYWNYLGAYYKEPKFFVVKDDIREHLASQGVDFEASYFFPKIEGLVFVRFDEGTTTEQKAEFYENSRKRCQMVERNTFETFRHDGKKYVYEQLKVMIPVILAVILLTLISTASNAAIMVRTNLKKYGIYYLEGMTWGQCMGVNILSFVLMDSLILVIAVVSSWIVMHTGLAGRIVLTIDHRELLACTGVLLFLGLCSAGMVLQQVSGKSAKTVLYQ